MYILHIQVIFLLPLFLMTGILCFVEIYEFIDEIFRIIEKLEDVAHTIKYLEKPIKTVGKLHKNANGRYEVQGIELTSGCGLEYLAFDEYQSMWYLPKKSTAVCT